jgi:DNA-binding response OmpR family regulator
MTSDEAFAPTATTLVVLREDFSISGEEGHPDPAVLERRFFNLLAETNTDVVILDLSRANGGGVETILKIRGQSVVPILVVCDDDAQRVQDYRTAGATDCIAALVDILQLNEALQRSALTSGHATALRAREVEAISFAGVSFHPQQNLVVGATGNHTRLTRRESRLLWHFVVNPWEIHSRAMLAESLHGSECSATDRAIDVAVNRLRTKLQSACASTEIVIKTEFRRGYRFVSDVSGQTSVNGKLSPAVTGSS